MAELVSIMHIVQIGIADVSTPVPGVHGVDRLGKLCTRTLVSATCVDPRVREAARNGLPTASKYLLLAVAAPVSLVI